MNREKAKRYVEFVVDDSGNGREWGVDKYAIVREEGQFTNPTTNCSEAWKYKSKLVGWKSEERNWENSYCMRHSYIVVAVHSYLDVELTNDEAEELARDYLCEVGFFKEGSFPADFIL